MNKHLPIIALVLSAVAVVLAGISRRGLPAPSDQNGPDHAALVERLRKLERKYAILEKDHKQLIAETRATGADGGLMATAANGDGDTPSRQAALERIARGIDKLGIIKAMEESVRNARSTLMDEELPDWPRIKAVDKLKALGQFNDEDIAALRQIWSESGDYNAKGGALKALSGHIDAGMRDEILLALEMEQQEGNPSPRFRASAVEALAPMMPDPEIRLWVEHIAATDPEPRVQMFASRFLPSKDQAPPADEPGGR